MSQKKLRTVIDWKPYPEQKPPEGLHLTRKADGEIQSERYHYAPIGSWWVDVFGKNRVTHFALPEQISTVEVEG